MSGEIEAVRRFSGLKVLVAGDAMLDSYYLGAATRLASEGPVPVVKGLGRRHMPGGAANTAANVRALGARVTLLAVVGNDHEADLLREELQRRDVGVGQLITAPDRSTTTKLRIFADHQFVARFDEETDDDLGGSVEGQFLDSFRRLFQESDAVIVSDYLKGTVTPAFVAQLGSLNREHRQLVVVDSKDLARRGFQNVSVITPNRLEAQRACSLPEGFPGAELPPSDVEGLGRLLLDRIGTRWAIITMGADGALLFERERSTAWVAAPRARNADPVGAGDTLTAALALALASGLEIQPAVRVAVDAAAIAAGKTFTAAVAQQELLQRLSLSTAGQVPMSLGERWEQYRAEGKRLVFTNGAFDGLHSGHIDFLREARRLGDLLIVGVNSDESLRRSSGQRPRQPEEERLSVIAALESVDHALLFDEAEPSALIREIRPHVHVKGGDYLDRELPEAEAVRQVGGEVVILPLLERRSSPLLKGKVARSSGRKVA